MEEDGIVYESLDCRHIVEPSFPTTLIEIIKISNVAAQPFFCYHDGFSFFGNATVQFKNKVFCSLSCAIACKSIGYETIMTGEDESELFFLYGDPDGLQDVRVAPERYELAAYGGTQSLAMFRENRLVREPDLGLHCVYDCHPINGVPVTLSDVLGTATFCSNSCMLAYVLDDSLIGSRAETIVRRCSKNIIIPAPPRQLLSIFGGFFSIEKFREAFDTSYYKILLPRTLLSNAQVLAPLGTNVSGFETHVEVHCYNALTLKPGELRSVADAGEKVLNPVVSSEMESKKPAIAKRQLGSGAQRKNTADKNNTCVIKISAGSGKIIGSSKKIPPPKPCSGKLPFKRFDA